MLKKSIYFSLIVLFSQISFANKTKFIRTDNGQVFGVQSNETGPSSYLVTFHHGYGCGRLPTTCSDFNRNSSSGLFKSTHWEFNKVDSGKTGTPFINPELPLAENLELKICTSRGPWKGNFKINILNCGFDTGSFDDASYGMFLFKNAVKQKSFKVEKSENDGWLSGGEEAAMKIVESMHCDVMLWERMCDKGI